MIELCEMQTRRIKVQQYLQFTASGNYIRAKGVKRLFRRKDNFELDKLKTRVKSINQLLLPK